MKMKRRRLWFPVIVGGLRELRIGYGVITAVSVYGAVARMRVTADFAAEERERRPLLSSEAASDDVYVQVSLISDQQVINYNGFDGTKGTFSLVLMIGSIVI
ncbi:hypothetical protein C2S52_021914 [Perilla frutescens var. hirtella]|nr:hypothetical protein C2S52_021914 [Perilla frutescens var. hirtella]